MYLFKEKEMRIKPKEAIASLLLLVAAGLASCGNGGKGAIKVYTRDGASGTREGFFVGIGMDEAKKDNSVLAKGYVEVASNGDMIAGVKNDEYGIGYISLSSLDGSGVRGLSYEGISPTIGNVLNGTYSLTRNFNYCKRSSYSNKKVSDVIDAFIAYMSTLEGKSTIAEHGGILETSNDDRTWESVKGDFDIDDQDNLSLLIKVGGSTSVKGIVSNLLAEFSSKCGHFAYEYNPTGSGDAYKRTNGSEKDGAYASDLAFASREFNSAEQMDDSIKGRMCIDAIVPIVNRSNAITGTDATTLRSIYSGEIRSWSEISR